MPRHTKLQLQVLRLYKSFLRSAAGRPGIPDHVKSEFKKNATVPKKNILQIEYLIRRAERQLQLMSKPSVRGVGVFERDSENKQVKS